MTRRNSRGEELGPQAFDPRSYDDRQIAPKATRDAVTACGYWLKTCLDLGWRKSDLDFLEALWWKYHDERGNLIQLPEAREAKGADAVPTCPDGEIQKEVEKKT